jgi:hypothetical protein
VAEPILYPRLRELLDAGAQLVEVLPVEEYADEHLPGGINMPLKNLDSASTGQLDRTRAVVVYCWDGLWLARGLPREGEKAAEPRAIDFARQDAVTCRLPGTLGEVRARVAASPYGFALVVDAGVLLGRLRKAALEHDPMRQRRTPWSPRRSTVPADSDHERLRRTTRPAGARHRGDHRPRRAPPRRRTQHRSERWHEQGPPQLKRGRSAQVLDRGA